MLSKVKNNKKKVCIASLLLVLIILTSCISTATATAIVPSAKGKTKVEVYINGNKVAFPDAQPFIVKKDERTLVPIRFIAENLGYKVDWDEENWFNGGKEDKKVTIANEGKTMELFVGQNYAYINGEKKVYDTKPLIDETRTFVPLRFVAENFDCTVDYRHNTKTRLMKVYIMTKDSDFEIPEEPSDSNIVAQGEGWDIRLDEVKGYDDNWIEPKLGVGYPEKDDDLAYCYLGIGVENYEDYKDKGYTFKTECISHPFDKVKIYDSWDDKYIPVDRSKKYVRKNNSIVCESGGIYSLYDFDECYDYNTLEPLSAKEGEKLQFKTTVSNGKMTKTYITNAEFRDKEFRRFEW